MSKEKPSYNMFIVLILQLIFLVLKIKGYIDWGWLWVVSPLWLYVLSVFMVSAIITLTMFFSIRKNIAKRMKSEVEREKDKQLKFPFGE
jgi:hypothetical protein